MEHISVPTAIPAKGSSTQRTRQSGNVRKKRSGRPQESTCPNGKGNGKLNSLAKNATCPQLAKSLKNNAYTVKPLYATHVGTIPTNTFRKVKSKFHNAKDVTIKILFKKKKK
jgi:hypothetical protein